MQIVIGTDIVAIKRIEASLEKFGESFLQRFLSEEEYRQLEPTHTQRIAGFWAAKEAAAKALGCGIGKTLGFHDMRIIKRPSGAPHLMFSDTIIRRFGISQVSLSVSHDGGFAVAVVAVILKGGEIT